MLNRLLNWIEQLLGLTRQVNEHATAIRELRLEVKTLSDDLRRLTQDLQTHRAETRLWAENLELRLKVQLLQFERRLPPPAPGAPPPPPTLE